MVVGHDSLKDFCVKAMTACGMVRGDAVTAAEILVTTDMWGIHTHGTKSLRQYQKKMRMGGFKADVRPRIVNETSACAIVDGDDALAQWGGNARAVSKVPEQEIGQACVNYLRQYGVNTDYIARGGERLGILYMEAGASQRSGKVVYDRGGSSFRDIEIGDIDWAGVLEGKDWFHITGTAPALGKKALAAAREGLVAAKGLGLTVSFDVNYRSTLWSIEDARRVLPELMQYVDVFVGTHHDARTLFDIDLEPTASAAALREKFGFKAVAYSLRQIESASVNTFSGLLCSEAGVVTGSEYRMEIVDRIGCGDAFSAGIVYGILTGMDAREVVDFAVASSCLKHSIQDDFNLVSLREVEELADGSNNGRVWR